jgi:hypothetical protein
MTVFTHDNENEGVQKVFIIAGLTGNNREILSDGTQTSTLRIYFPEGHIVKYCG